MSTLAFRCAEEAVRQTGRLAVSAGHVLHWEDWGATGGVPAVVLHGGPGSGFSAALRRFFDPARYRVVAFDQRGCGRSTPRGETRNNDTALLIDDIEALRRHLGIAHWLVVGGSWGATLAIAYAAQHREVVSGMLLRGLFVPSQAELDWFFQGAAAQFPAAWQRLAAAAPATAQSDLLTWLGEVFAGPDRLLQRQAALAWLDWERTLAGAPATSPSLGDEALDAAIDRYRVQVHYLAHRCWLDEAGLSNACAGVQGLPVQLLHGRADAVCRPAAAWKAHEAMPGSRFRWVEGAGHDPFHPAMVAAMEDALEVFARQCDFAPKVVSA
ncbi:MAG: alpha/beta fold hydrolase [Rhodoferax sp.]|nr:alpha/beta fold hydrolase [Rhodoferax sp.]